jgi:hypothetical protein
MATNFTFKITETSPSLIEKTQSSRYQPRINGSVETSMLNLYCYRILDYEGLLAMTKWMDYSSLMVWMNIHTRGKHHAFQVQTTASDNLSTSGNVTNLDLVASVAIDNKHNPISAAPQSERKLGFLFFK